MTTRPPLPPFTHETTVQKARLAEDGWNSRDSEGVALAYSPDSQLRFVNINDLPIRESGRKFHWLLGGRPDDHPGLSDFDF